MIGRDCHLDQSDAGSDWQYVFIIYSTLSHCPGYTDGRKATFIITAAER